MSSSNQMHSPPTTDPMTLQATYWHQGVELRALPGGAYVIHPETSKRVSPTDRPLTKQDIQALSCHPNLRTLSGHLVPPLDRPLFFPESAPSPFPHLEELNLKATGSAFIAFVDAIGRLSHLKRFSLQVVCGDPKALDIPPTTLVRSISDICDPEALERLCVRVHGDDSATGQALELMKAITAKAPDVHADADVFQPLLPFVKMREFRFDLPWVFHLEDRLFQEMAEEWPDLEELYFATKSYSRCANLDACTLAALAPFGSHCPRLKALGFPFDAMKCGAREDLLDDVPWCPDVPGYRSQADQCTTLLVTRSPVSEQASNLVNAASFLSHVFPRLEDIIQGPFDDTEEGKAHARSWGEVESYVMVLNNNRQNERQRLGLEDDLPGSPDQQPPTTPSEQSPDDTAGAWMWSSGNDE